MLIVRTNLIGDKVLKAVVGYKRFSESCLPDDRDSMMSLYDSMVDLHGNADVVVVGYDISSDQYYILMSSSDGYYIFGCLNDGLVFERVLSDSVSDVRKKFEETVFEEDEPDEQA